VRAIAVEDFGAEPGLMELPDPEPGPGEVLVAIDAAAVNPMDWKAAQGALRAMMENEFPLVTGFDAAGQLVIPVQDEVTLADGAAAIARRRRGGARGKTLIRI
jgi:NADPH:quinone reductase-like Zn-dependent oxidoreductase